MVARGRLRRKAQPCADCQPAASIPIRVPSRPGASASKAYPRLPQKRYSTPITSFPRKPKLTAIAAHLARRAHLIALALFAIVGIAVLEDYGTATDEGAQRRIGTASFNYMLGDADALPENVNRYYGVAFEVPLIAVERIFRLETHRAAHLSRRLISHAFFLIGGFFAWLLAYRLFGSRLIALFAMLIFLLHPRIYAHSFFNTKDLPFLSMFMVALYLTHRAFRRDSLRAFVLCGVSAGLLANIRIVGVFLPPIVLGALAMDAAAAMRRGGGGRNAL